MWYDKGKIHRKILPAVIYANGKQEWYHRGLLHRINADTDNFSKRVFDMRVESNYTNYLNCK